MRTPFQDLYNQLKQLYHETRRRLELKGQALQEHDWEELRRLEALIREMKRAREERERNPN